MRDLPRAANEAITAETQGEVIRWVGRPDPGQSFWRTTPIWLMGIPWLALSGGIFGSFVAAALFGKVRASGAGGWEPVILVVAILFCGAFVLIGFGMIGAPFWVWWKSRRMAYVVTDRRFLRIGWRRGGVEVKSFDPSTFIAIERSERRNGSGTLTITTHLSRDSDGDTSKETEMVIGVKDVRAADKFLRAFMEERRGGGGPGGGHLEDRASPRDKAA